MKTTLKPEKDNRCDCCGKFNTIIQRRYKDEGYCPNCYRTWFIHKPCSNCGVVHRLHKKEQVSICHDCIVRQPCTRCGGDAIQNGANTDYGRVCGICYVGYFKEKKQCFECGKMKRNISSYSDLSHNQKVCTSCYQRHFNETCQSCRRYRKLIDTNKGRVCKKCDSEGLVSCRDCQKLMPAGIGIRCWDCYWKQRLEHEIKLNSYLFSTESLRRDYRQFTVWFAENKGVKTAKLKNNNFIEFFIRCEELWGEIPSYKVLVNEFKPNGLRKNLTVLRWLIDTSKVVEDKQAKKYVAEQERIIKLLNKFNNGLPKEVSSYYDYLMGKHTEHRTSLNTVRMSLQPVVGLYTSFEIESACTPNQEQIDAYLLDKSGQYNSLYGFITFLNNKFSNSLKCNQPKGTDIARANRKKLEKNILQFASRTEPLSEKDKLIWYQLAMKFFHETNISLKNLKTATLETGNNNMEVLIFNEKYYWIPDINTILTN